MNFAVEGVTATGRPKKTWEWGYWIQPGDTNEKFTPRRVPAA